VEEVLAEKIMDSQRYHLLEVPGTAKTPASNLEDEEMQREPELSFKEEINPNP
jgi:hypothetical protein